MKVIKLVLTTILFVGIISCNSQSNSGQEDLSSLSNIRFDRTKSFHEFLESVRHNYQLPAIAAAVVNLDSIIFLDATGYNNVKDSLKINKSSLFNLGSCAKSLTSLLVAKYVGLGDIDWDTKLLETLNIKNKLVDKDYSDITVTDLLSHSSGFPQYSSDEDFFQILSLIPELSDSFINKRNQFVVWNCRNFKTIGKGEFHYSNGGYVAVASMLESITGRSWESLINDEILKPLDLNSAIIGFAQDKDSGQPWRHFDRDNNGNPILLDPSQREIPDLFNPAGNISMTIEDFAKYAQFQLKCLFENDETLLKPELVNKLHQPIINIAGNENYGLGWGVTFYDGQKVSAHSGGDQSTYAIIAIDHKMRKAWVIMTNIGDSNAELACGNIIMETQ